MVSAFVSQFLLVPAMAQNNKQKIAMGDGNHACAVETNGHLICWGSNESDQLNIPVPLIEAEVSAVSTGIAHTCAITNNKIFCWGDNRSGQLNVPQQVRNWGNVIAGDRFSCGIDFNSRLHCWGDQEFPDNIENIKEIQVLPAGIGQRQGICGVFEDKVQCWIYPASTLYPDLVSVNVNGQYERLRTGKSTQIYASYGQQKICVDNLGSNVPATTPKTKCYRIYSGNSSGRNPVVKEEALPNHGLISDVYPGMEGNFYCALDEVGEKQLKCWMGTFEPGYEHLLWISNLRGTTQLALGRMSGFQNLCAFSDAGLQCYKLGFQDRSDFTRVILVNNSYSPVPNVLAVSMTDEVTCSLRTLSEGNRLHCENDSSVMSDKFFQN